ncbi:MAG: hypothetical protein P1V97_20480, partial [Planctomycetota bacterium]|nr:hypothetical protein [Planctomycetota bacterium]
SGQSFESGPGIFSQVTDNALAMSSRGSGRASLKLPIVYTGQSFRLRGRLRFNWMDGRSNLRFRFAERKSESPSFIELNFYVNSQGGDALSWRRAVEVNYFRANQSFVNTSFSRLILFRQFKPDENMDFEIFYREDQRSLVLRLKHGTRSIERYFLLRQGLNSGPYQLEVISWNSSNRLKPIVKQSSQVEIYELSFHAPKNAISIDQKAERDKLAEAQYHFVRRDLKRAEELVKAWRKNAKAAPSKDRCQAAFLLALIKSRLGNDDQAKQFLREAKLQAPKEFEGLWKNALGLMKPSEHMLLVEVLGLKKSGREWSESVGKCMKGIPDWETVALLHLGGGPRAMGQSLAPVSWLFSGHYDLAERLLKSPQNKNPRTDFYRGLLAYNRRRYKRVLDLWKDVDWKNREYVIFRDYYIRAQHIVNYADKQSDAQ